MRTPPWVIWMTIDMVFWMATLALADSFPRAAIVCGAVGIVVAIVAGAAELKARRLRRGSK